MDNNHMDDYVLVLEDRTEVKNEAEVGKLSVVSNIDDKGNSRQPLPKKQIKATSSNSIVEMDS